MSVIYEYIVLSIGSEKHLRLGFYLLSDVCLHLRDVKLILHFDFDILKVIDFAFKVN